MIDIYRTLYEVPQDVLFIDTPRLDLQGVRWAPASFLETTISAVPLFRQDVFAIVEQAGLHIRKDCMFVNGDLQLQADPASGSKLYFVNDEVGYNVAFNCNLSATTKSRFFSNAAIILDQTASYFPDVILGALVTDIQEQDGVIQCCYVTNLQVFTKEMKPGLKTLNSA
jgi:hypothetical protein